MSADSDNVIPFQPRVTVMSDDTLAAAFVDQCGFEIRYDHTRGMWFRWHDTHWLVDEVGATREAIRLFCRAVSRSLETPSQVKGMQSSRQAYSIETFARDDARVRVQSDLWNQDPWFLATPDGTVDLRTGELHPSDPKHLITKLTACGPSEFGDECPLWDRFLHEACAGDHDQVKFLQKMCGYCLTGDTREHVLFFLYGPGGNGKSVFLNVLTGILHDYARTAPMEAFTSHTNDRHSTELAMLAGSRLVTATETEEGKRWAEARIKQLTGGDRISARFMRQDFFEFRPVFKLVVVGNHMPALTNVDEAAKRRFRLVPFENRPITVDNQLEHRLRAEWPAILRWMITGCRLWLLEGIKPPRSVTKATETYFAQQDVLQQWFDDRVVLHPERKEDSVLVFADWSAYAKSMGEFAGSKRSFTQRLEKRGFKNGPTHIGGRPVRVYYGLGLRHNSEGYNLE